MIQVRNWIVSWLPKKSRQVHYVGFDTRPEAEKFYTDIQNTGCHVTITNIAFNIAEDY